MIKTKELCSGCRDDYYNHGSKSTTGECWMFEKAKVKKRYVIGWRISQDKKENFSKVVTLNCHSEPGSFAYYDELPAHLK